MVTRPCPEECCRQMRFFGSTGGHKYTKGHSGCKRCKGKGVVSETPDDGPRFDGKRIISEVRKYMEWSQRHA